MRTVLFINLRLSEKSRSNWETEHWCWRESLRQVAKLKRGKFGRPVLVAAEGTPSMTTEAVTTLIEELS